MCPALTPERLSSPPHRPPLSAESPSLSPLAIRYNLFDVCRFCAQFFDPDYPGGVFYPKKRPPKKRYLEKNVYGAVAAPSRVAATKAKAMAEVGVTAQEVTLTPFLDDRVAPAPAPAPAPAAAATAAAPVAAKAATGAAAVASHSPPAKKAERSAGDDEGGEPHGGSPQPHFHTHAGPFPVTHTLHGLSALVAEKVRPAREFTEERAKRGRGEKPLF